MWFLIKTGLTFAMVLVGLSYFSGRPVAEVSGSQQIEMQDAVSAAAQAYQYLSAICIEKPQVCEKGAETFSALGVRATEGARVAFELLDQQFGDRDMAVAERADPEPTPFPAKLAAATTGTIPASDPVFTGTVPVPQKRPTVR